MAKSKNAILRYQVIDRSLRNPGRKYSITDLVNECNKALFEIEPYSDGIKKRQVYNDIRFMKSEQGWFAPIEVKKINRIAYYYYGDKNFSINNQPLTQMEANQLRSALQILSRFKGAPQFNWVNEMIPKLEQEFGLNKNSEEIIAFDENMDLLGLEKIGELFNAIYYKKVLNILYRPFFSKEMNLNEIHPYFLKQYNRRWFLFGYNPSDKYIMNLALDRIESITEIDKTYIENNQVNYTDYFDEIVGVTKNESENVKVIIWFATESAPYVLTKPFHGTQKTVKENENGLWISIEVIPNWELESQILSFGENAKVISPEFFRDEIAKRTKRLYNIYHK